MKKILFFGDNIPGNNYGSIATTESILEITKQVAKGHEIRIIDYRYSRKATPPNGLPPYTISHTNENFLSELGKRFPKLKNIWNKIRKKNDSNIHVPYKYSMYEEYFCKLQNGEVLPYEKKMIEWADIVIFSGEGTLVHGIDKHGKYLVGGLYMLFMLWLIKVKYNKQVSVVNHTVDPENFNAEEIIRNIYPLLDYVAVREKYSLNYLKKINVLNTKFVPDALFSYKPKVDWVASEMLLEQIDFSKPYICIGDTSGFSDTKYSTSVKWDIGTNFGIIIEKLKKIVPQIIFVDGFRGKNKIINKIIKDNNIGYINLKNCSYHELTNIFKGAELFISGRWHASILASIAYIPVILMGADSHKTKALFDVLEYDGYFFDLESLPIHIDELIEATINTLERKEQIRNHLIKKIPVLSLMSQENILHLKENL